MASTLLDMVKIAAAPSLDGRVQAAVYKYSIETVRNEVGGPRRNYAARVINDYNTFRQDFIWAAASNANLADSVVAKKGSNFIVSDTGAIADQFVTTATPTVDGATDALINAAVATAWGILANA